MFKFKWHYAFTISGILIQLHMELFNKNIVVYTCILGNYDVLLPPRQIEPNIHYVCFTDETSLTVLGWEIRHIADEWGGAVLTNRYAKMHPHLLFPEYEVSIYVDGSIEIIGNLSTLVELALKNNDIALYSHPFRNCAYEEADICASFGFDWYWRIERQMNCYRVDQFPKYAGLFECTVIIRKHSVLAVQTLMESWWDAVINGVKRDQLSIVYLAWKQKMTIYSLGISDFRINRIYFSLNDHRRPIRLSIYLRGFAHRRLFIQYGYSVLSKIKKYNFKRYIKLIRKFLKIFVQGFYSRINSNRMRPKIIINSIPKSGTNLVQEIIHQFPSIYGSFSKTLKNSDKNVLQKILSLKPGECIAAHLYFSDEILSAIKSENIKLIFVVRDFRDSLLSHMNYLAFHDTNHPHNFFFKHCRTTDELLDAYITGGVGFIPWQDMVHNFRRWYNLPNVLVVRYEDLITNDVDQELVKTTIKKIIDFIDVDVDVDAIISNMYDVNGLTYNYPAVNKWKHDLNIEQRIKITSALSDELFFYDYIGKQDNGLSNEL